MENPNMKKSPCCKADFEWIDGDGVEYEQLACESCEKEYILDIEVKRYWDDLREVDNEL